jgi:pilus assembly protein FimV
MCQKTIRVAGVGKKSLIASLVTLALGLSPAAGYAAGLGRLTLHSAIGQPLRADIELVSVRPDEFSTLTARVASPDAYRNANINYSSALVGARATVERGPGGGAYIRLTSSRPLEEPYIDLLIELTWSTGRLVREYTALVDPPGFGSTQVATPSAVPDIRPAAGAPMAAPLARTPASPGESDKSSYGPVQSGDTLRKIATGVKPEGVSLDQVLVGIFRNNPDAFINNNMNLLRTGRILRIPDAAELGAISSAEAGKEIRVQTADWNAYRQRVAGAVPETAVSDARAASGKVTTQVEDTAPAAPPGKEVVKVSKGAPGAASGAAEKDLQDRIRVLEEEATAREKTLKDANERIASLEKTLKDMQRLLEMKSVPVPPPAAVAPPAEKSEPAPLPAEAGKPSVPAEATKPEAPAPVTPPAAETKPQAAPPAPAPQPKAEAKAEPAPPPPAEAWYQDPTLLGGALLGLGLLGGLAYVMARRRRSDERLTAEPSLRSAPVAAPPGSTAASETAVPIADATTEMPAAPVAAAAAAGDDVDPIQEADVYIAYGRDAQAEEILKEALVKDPSRQEIKLKLLEIYAARKSKNDFNALAEDLHKSTHGRGDTWLKAATMGFALDPENVLYAAGKDSTIASPVGVATDVNLDFDLDMVTAAGAPTTVTDVPLDAGEDQTVKTMALSPERMEALRAEGAAAARPATDTHPIVPDIDLTDPNTAPKTDITLDPAARSGPITDVNLDLPKTATDSNVIDFEFDPGKTMKIEPAAAAAFDQTVVISPENQAQARDLGVEIDLASLDAPAPTIPQGSATPPATPADATADISFDFELPPESPPTADIEVPPTDIKLDVPEFKPADTTTIDFALDTVSLDLGSANKSEAAGAPAHDDHWYDVQTKFDLAKAYQEMGDKEGAREILAEVIKEGDAQQQAEANELLAKLD